MIEETKKDTLTVAEGRTFFCSELFAKCFKVCGVMDNV